MTEKALGAPPTVSVVILNYNGIAHLGACLSSLAQTTYRDFETLLVDNGSGDGSVAYVKERFPWVRVLELKTNLGFAEGNNVGMRAAAGRYIILLNNDTEVEPSWLGGLVEVAEADGRIGACQPKIRMFNDRRLLNSAGGRCTFLGYGGDTGFGEVDDGRYDVPRDIFYACGAAVLLRREALERVGLFDPKYFIYHEDVDLCWRMHLYGYRVVYVPSSLIYHKVGGSTPKLSQLYRREKNMTRTLLKNYQLSTLAKILPIYLAHKVKLGWTHLLEGHHDGSRAIVKGLAWNFLNLPDTVRWRRRIHAGRVTSDRQIFEKMYWPGARLLR